MLSTQIYARFINRAMIVGGFDAVATRRKGPTGKDQGRPAGDLPQTERATTKINELSRRGQRMKGTAGDKSVEKVCG